MKGIDMGAPIDQKADDLQVAFLRSDVQRRASELLQEERLPCMMRRMQVLSVPRTWR